MKTDDVVWTRPGLRASLQKAPSELDVVSGGWVFHDGAEDKPLLMDDDVRLEVGHQYLAVLSYADISLFGSTTPRPDADGPTWVAVDWVKFDNGVIDPKAALDNAAEFPARATVAGKTTAVAAKLLSATSIDPKAKPYMDLDPMLRYQKVQDLQFATMEPKPGPGPGEKE